MIIRKRNHFFALFCVLLFCSICVLTSRVSAKETCDHEWSEWLEETEATCTNAGREYRYCYMCNATEYRKGDPATGHSWDVWETVMKSTIYHKGKKMRSCYDCFKVQYRIIPKKKLRIAGKKALKAAKKYMKYARVYNVKKMKKCFTKPPKNYFFEKKWYLAQIARKYNKKRYKYKIIDVDSKKKTARIKVKITYPDGYRPFKKTFNQVFRYYLKYPNASDSAVDMFMRKQFPKNIKKMGMKKSKKTIYFRMKKTKKGWKIKKASFDIGDTTNCGYEQAYKDF